MNNTRRIVLGAAFACAAAASVPALAAKPLVIGFSQVGAESEWRTANTRSIKETAAAQGITLRFADAQQRQENQVKAIRSFIAQRVEPGGADHRRRNTRKVRGAQRRHPRRSPTFAKVASRSPSVAAAVAAAAAACRRGRTA